jgi:hypothetical protein
MGTTRQATISRTTTQDRPINAISVVRGGFSRTLTSLDHALLGGSRPRAHKREGFPEIELHELMAARVRRTNVR